MKKSVLPLLTLFILLLLQSFPLKAQWTSDTLSYPKTNLFKGASGNRAVFFSGYSGGIYGYPATIETYDFATSTWTLANPTNARRETKGVVAGDKVFLGGGVIGPYTDPVTVAYANVYDLNTHTLTNFNLTQARIVGGVGTLGGKVYFAGGYRGILDGFSKKVDIVDVATNAKTSVNLSLARRDIAVGTAGSKIVFAGGNYGFYYPTYDLKSTNRVDIYNNATNTWSTAALSQARAGITVASAGNKILFIGGTWITVQGVQKYYYKTDVYDVVTNTWSVVPLSISRTDMGVTSAGNKVFIAGGTLLNGNRSNRVDVYDASTDSWSTMTLPAARTGLAALSVGAKVMFAGGFAQGSTTPSGTVYIYDQNASSWSSASLSVARAGITPLTVNNHALFAGGAIDNYTLSNRVDIYTDVVALEAAPVVPVMSQAAAMRIFPNPARDYTNLILEGDDIIFPVEVAIIDNRGSIVHRFTLQSPENQIELSDLPAGIYYVKWMGSQTPAGRMVIGD